MVRAPSHGEGLRIEFCEFRDTRHVCNCRGKAVTANRWGLKSLRVYSLRFTGPFQGGGSFCLAQRTPLNNAGFTIDTYYRLGTFDEVEAAVKDWHRKRIQDLELE